MAIGRGPLAAAWSALKSCWAALSKLLQLISCWPRQQKKSWDPEDDSTALLAGLDEVQVICAFVRHLPCNPTLHMAPASNACRL